ncbi:MAG: glycosyltransferase [Candidatus Omnitrophica bacterium]|nr:glycosyltransferase [Candidatus Omnitrophota bacterium]
MPGKVPLTVVVITKNEEANIEECLASVSGWADELIVVDD